MKAPISRFPIPLSPIVYNKQIAEPVATSRNEGPLRKDQDRGDAWTSTIYAVADAPRLPRQKNNAKYPLATQWSDGDNF